MKNTTASLIENTLIEMCKNRTFQSIKVKEICTEADISKQTFYNHFKDKYDIVTSIYLKDIQSESTIRETNPLNQLKAQFANLWNRRDFYQNVFDDKSQNSLFQFAKTHSEVFNGQVASSSGKELTPEQQYLLSYNSYGWVGCFDDWIHGRLNFTSDEMAEIIYRTVPHVTGIKWESENS